MKKILTLLLAAASLTACDIDRLPYSSMAAEQITNDPSASLESLMNGMYAQLKTWSDPMHRCGEYAGDNMMIRGSSTDAFYEFISFSRTPVNYRLQNFWDYGYKAVAQASNIIKMIEEGQSAEIDNQLGECYYVRGMMYFYLCRAYGRPYYQAPDKNLGVPIVNGTPDDIMGDLLLPDRSTVKETYEQAISDLKKAEEMMTINKGAAYASKEAAQAMLSRVYLYMSGTYENPNREYAQLAVDYADKVINSGTYSLLPREEFMKYNTLTPENNDESIFVVKRVASEFSGYDHYYLEIGNTSLRPETTRQGNLGVTWSRSNLGFLDFISLSADTYYNKVKDKIVAVPTMFVWKMSNVGKVETIGVDVNLSAECRLNQQMKLYLTGNYNFMQAEDVTDRNSKTWRNQIVYTPRHSGSGSLTLETPWLNMTYNLTASSERYTLAQNLPKYRIDAYTDHGISLSRSFRWNRHHLRIQADALNLGNKNYEIIRFYPMPGRNYRITINYYL